MITGKLGAVAVALILVAMFSGCQSLYTKRVTFENHPIAIRVKDTVVDDERIEYSVIFRNVGREIVSFDYTIADEPDVPHVDSQGPNSGLVENLYPGAEVEVDNPAQTFAVWVTIGEVTYGKKPAVKLQQIYQPGQEAGDDLDLPPL